MVPREHHARHPRPRRHAHQHRAARGRGRRRGAREARWVARHQNDTQRHRGRSGHATVGREQDHHREPEAAQGRR